MTNVEALQALYAALGGDPADVADASTIVEVLNAIAAKYEGEDDATLNPEAIANITAVVGNITPAPTSEYNAYLGEDVEEEDEEEFNYTSDYSSLLTSISIPGVYKSIGDNSFDNCTLLDTVIINDGVESIGEQAFASCHSLKNIAIPDSVTSIGSQAFYYCTKLTSIAIPDSVTSIGENAFGFCNNLETITINQAEDSITGAPWGAPETTQIVWTG